MKRKVTTDNLNTAAFYTSYGAKVLSIDGTWPRNRFTLIVPIYIYLLEKYVGIISYRKYFNNRINLKVRAMKASGINPMGELLANKPGYTIYRRT